MRCPPRQKHVDAGLAASLVVRVGPQILSFRRVRLANGTQAELTWETHEVPSCGLRRMSPAPIVNLGAVPTNGSRIVSLSALGTNRFELACGTGGLVRFVVTDAAAAP